MNRSAEKVLTYLTGNENIDAIAVDDLQKLAAENPYFPVSQFLLAKKLKDVNDEQYSFQVQKTALYFSNPYWLQYQIADGEAAEETAAFRSVEIRAEEKPTDNIVLAEASAIEEIAPRASDLPAQGSISQINYTDETSQETEIATTEAVNKPVENPDSSIDADQINTEEEEPEIIQAEEEMAAIARNTNEEAENFINHLDAKTIINDDAAVRLPDHLSQAAETEVIELKEEMAGVTHDSNQMTEDFLKDAAVQEKNIGLPQDDEHDKMFQNIKAMLDASADEADADTKNAVLPIDPYYTIDYFASQGIKLELDQNPKDQLGQNLKKFTQWLKHMKKLGPEDATEAISRTETDAEIQQIADSSNTVREVVTEAMAAVLEKQGKKDKAIELYNKLSFLNPDKSAYFAGKIKKLKGI